MSARKLIVAFLIVCTLLLYMNSCVDSISFKVPDGTQQLVVEGVITDQPGPYQLKISSGFSVNADSVLSSPVSGINAILFDDEGRKETFTEVSPGLYETQGQIKGKIGHRYFIRLETPSGAVYESTPTRLNPAGSISAIRYEFENRSSLQTFGEVAKDVFNVFVDAEAPGNENVYMRWRFTGTYKVVTFPSLHSTWNPPYTPYKNPFPCSGYIVVGGPDFSGGLLQRVGDCECCECWITQYETTPTLSDEQLTSGKIFRNLKVGEVPINNFTFFDKYMVAVEQFSLDTVSFEFFKILRDQKRGASSLFQPPPGRLKGNIKALNNSNEVVGLFWASAVSRRYIFLSRTDVPYGITRIDTLTYPCYQQFKNSTNVKPSEWR